MGGHTGPGNGMNVTAKINTTSSILPPPNPPCWTGFAPLAACLFNLQRVYNFSRKARESSLTKEIMEATLASLFTCINFSAYISPEAAAQSAATTTWGSGVTAVAFDPTRGGSMISVVIVEGQYMSPYDPDEGPSITGWRVQYSGGVYCLKLTVQDAIGCTQSAAEDGIVSLNSVIAVLDVDFHSLPSIQHRQQYGPSLDRIKCRLFGGTNAQDVRALVLDMQARLLLDMLCKELSLLLLILGHYYQILGKLLVRH
ncbi:hypothetical protein HPP92_028519 [Vanilla planifolia]|uniref:Uncharacterized protein n=1 Tax=Vanilla planifolia TaxID=51239 RepID=A0A835P5C1_VANPL|nr:hypothetical protein HPP92_028519 [Vanilla planifolia]